MSEAGSVRSADPTVTDDQSEKRTSPVVYKLANIQGKGADTSSSQAKKKALKRPSEGDPGPSKKRRRVTPELTRKRKAGTGALTPPAKKTKVSPQSSSASESEDESFDPTLEREDEDDFKRKVPKTIEKYIDKHFRRSLSKEERTAMLRRHPKPDVEAALPPKLDGFVADFAGKKLDKARDSQLAKIQGAMLYAASLLTNLWADLIEQGLSNDAEAAAIHVSDILDTIQRSLVLLGNANSLISETRREIALESIHPSLKKYGKGAFIKAKADLFGEEFKDTLVKKVEADSALSKAVSIVSKTSGSTSKIYQKPSGNRFFRKPDQSVRCCVRQGVPAVQPIPRERKTDPQQAIRQEGQCLRQTRSKPIRQEPIQQPAKQVKTLPQAGKLQYFMHKWEHLTQDPWILDTIQGYRIPFREQPPVKQIPSFVFTEMERIAISTEIEKLLEKEAISPAEATDGFISNVFLVPKKEDQWRLILNLKALNAYTIREHFKMEDICSVKDLLVRGDYMCKLDLKDAYLSVPISAAHRKYL